MDRTKKILATSAGKSPTSIMKELLEVLTPSVIVPEVDKYYVFIYRAKTKGITYDQHPLVVVTGIFRWGFTGWNMHAGPRRYTWGEVITNLYEVRDDELNTVGKLPIALFKQS